MANSTSNRFCRTCGSNTAYPEHDRYHQSVLRERANMRKLNVAAEKFVTLLTEVHSGSGDLKMDAEYHVNRAIDRLGLTEPPRPKTVNRKTISNGKRRQVWDRDDWTCKLCGGHAKLTIDHIIPVVAGGTDDMDNLQTLCFSCNASKGARL